MKKNLLFPIFVLLAFVGGVVVWGSVKAQAASLPPGSVQKKLDSLTESWWRSLDGEGWLYVAYETDSPNSIGKDPDTGWQLFKHYREEVWSLSNNKGEIQTVLIRTTDKEHPDHIYRLAWEGGHLLREPGFRGGAPDWRSWDYHFILDSGCAREVRNAVQSGDDAAKRTEILSKDGKDTWEVSLVQYFSPIQLPDLQTKALFTASRLTCVWNKRPAHPISVMHFYVTENGEKVLSERIFNFEAHRAKNLPADMQALFGRLEARNRGINEINSER